MEETKEVLGQDRQEPACGVVASKVGTISADKRSTKALERIIKRQENRIEELATKLGTLQCITDTDTDNWKRLLAATSSKGVSEALAKVEKWAELCITAQPKYYPSASPLASADNCPVPVTELAG